jgi:hypothetical protein
MLTVSVFFLQETKERCVAINNKLAPDSHDNKRQVRNLLEVVRDLLKKTGDSYFTNALLRHTAEAMATSIKNAADMLDMDPNRYFNAAGPICRKKC